MSRNSAGTSSDGRASVISCVVASDSPSSPGAGGRRRLSGRSDCGRSDTFLSITQGNGGQSPRGGFCELPHEEGGQRAVTNRRPIAGANQIGSSYSNSSEGNQSAHNAASSRHDGRGRLAPFGHHG